MPTKVPIIIDTSALLRFFTRDIEQKAVLVKNLLESDNIIIIPDVVFPELEYVLLSTTYNTSRSDALQVFRFLTAQKNIIVSKTVKKAVSMYETSKLDLADCIIAATAIVSTGQLASFDNDLKKLSELKNFWM